MASSFTLNQMYLNLKTPNVACFSVMVSIRAENCPLSFCLQRFSDGLNFFLIFFRVFYQFTGLFSNNHGSKSSESGTAIGKFEW